MNYYVVGYLPRAADRTRPDLRTGRIVGGHTERATAERLARMPVGLLPGLVAAAGARG